MPGSPRLHNATKSNEVSDGSQALARTEFSYDDATTTGNLIEQRSWDSTKGSYSSTLSASNSVSVSYQYDNNTADSALRYGNRTLMVDALGHQTKYVYGSVGGFTDLYPTQVIAAYGTSLQRTTNQEYDLDTGLMTSVTDVENDVTTSTAYDVFGRPITVKAAVGTTAETHTNTSYDDLARRVIVRSDLDNVEDRKLVRIQHYDQLGRVRLTRQLEDASSQSATSETTGIKVQTRYLIDSQNHLSYQLVSNPYRAAKSSEASAEMTMGWTRSKSDDGGRVIEVENFSGSAQPLPFDTSPNANTSSTGRVTTVYDGIYTTVKDQAEKVRRSKVDSLGRLVRIDEPNSNTNPRDLGGLDTPSQQTNYSYNALGNLTLVCQGGTIQNNQCQSGQTRSFQYSSLSRLVSATNPESGAVQYKYDDGGNLILKIGPRDGGVDLPNCLIPYSGGKVAICYGYDALNRITTRTYNDGTSPNYNDRTPQVTYSYDTSPYGKGRLASVSSSVSTTSYQSYDALGRVTASSQTTDGQTYTMPEYAYNRAGNLKSQQYPSGMVIVNQYDAAGRLAGVKNLSSSDYFVGGSPLSNDANRLQYAAHGAVSAMRLGNGLWEHTNFNSRLQPTQISLGTSSTDSSKLQLDYGYGTSDNNGNVRSQTISFAGLTSAIVQVYNYDQLNRLSSFTETGTLSQTFTYDAYGNRAVTAGYVEDPLLTPQTLTAYSTTNNVANNRLAASIYDAAGNQKQDAAGRTFAYDAENHQTGFSGVAAATYSYDGDGRRVKKKEIKNDVDGRNIGQKYFYGSGSPDNVRQKFTQKERDSESGLDYFGARYYSGIQGRFTSADPVSLTKQHIANPQRWNAYAYVLNNPLALVDPDGKDGKGKGGGQIVDIFITLEPGQKPSVNFYEIVSVAKAHNNTVNIYTVADGTATSSKAAESLRTPGRTVLIFGHSISPETSQKAAAQGGRLQGQGLYFGPNGNISVSDDGKTPIVNDIVNGKPTISSLGEVRAKNVLIFACDTGSTISAIGSSMRNGNLMFNDNGGDEETGTDAQAMAAYSAGYALASNGTMENAQSAAQGAIAADEGIYCTVTNGYCNQGDQILLEHHETRRR